MKKKILFCLAAIAMFGCSGEDAATVDINQNNFKAFLSTGRQLNTVTSQDGDVYAFENNQIISYTYGSGEYVYDYTYNNDGQLSGMIGKDAVGTVFFTRTVGYDNDGRIIAKNDAYINTLQNSTKTENVVYIYNNDNSVTADFTSYDDTVKDRIYYFNAQGKVSHITINDEIVQQMTYTANNITVMGNTDYLYDESTPVKGHYNNMYTNQFSSYKNFVVYNGFMLAGNVSDKYLVRIDENPGEHGDVDYQYIFNDEGYPVQVDGSSLFANHSTFYITYK